MGTHATRLERVLAAEQAAGTADSDNADIIDIAGLDLAEVRRRRAEADREETDLSYLRRLLHGRLDIIQAEQERRAGGTPGSLVDRLPAILADDPPAHARSARHLEVDPGAEPGEYRARMEALLADSDLSSVLDSTDAELAAAREVLAGYEREVSAYRVRVQRVEDRFADELTRRYREGQATVDAVLTEELLLNGEQRME
jgi:hypothetical protein